MYVTANTENQSNLLQTGSSVGAVVKCNSALPGIQCETAQDMR